MIAIFGFSTLTMYMIVGKSKASLLLLRSFFP